MHATERTVDASRLDAFMGKVVGELGAAHVDERFAAGEGARHGLCVADHLRPRMRTEVRGCARVGVSLQ